MSCNTCVDQRFVDGVMVEQKGESYGCACRTR